MIDLDSIKRYTLDKPPRRNVLGDNIDYDKLSDEHKDQILFLDKTATSFLYDYFSAIKIVTGPMWSPFEQQNFKTVEEFTDIGAQDQLKKWLYNRGIPFSHWVILLPNYTEGPVYLTWKMVVKYAPDIFGQLDDIVIFDKTNNWCLFYFHEGELFFGRDNIFNTEKEYSKIEALLQKKRKYPRFRHPFIDF